MKLVEVGGLLLSGGWEGLEDKVGGTCGMVGGDRA